MVAYLGWVKDAAEVFRANLHDMTACVQEEYFS